MLLLLLIVPPGKGFCNSFATQRYLDYFQVLSALGSSTGKYSGLKHVRLLYVTAYSQLTGLELLQFDFLTL